MNQILLAHLKALCRSTPDVILFSFVAPINKVCERYSIDSLERQAMFIAQCAHESGEFKTMVENLNYSAERLMAVWPKRFPTLEKAQAYARQPERLANYVYAGRNGNGDEASGDGWKFRGRGPIQLTGRRNYGAASRRIYGDENLLLVSPQIVEESEGGILTAADFWNENNLNVFADSKDIVGSTKAINGGIVGLDHRRDLFERALLILKDNHEH